MHTYMYLYTYITVFNTIFCFKTKEKFKLNQMQNDQLAVIINRSHGSMHKIWKTLLDTCRWTITIKQAVRLQKRSMP